MISAKKELVIQDLSFGYGRSNLLSDFHFSAASNEINVIVGPNGSGKSTLFKLISGLLSVTAGSISIGDVRVDGMPAHERFRKGLGIAFQKPCIVPKVSVIDNMRLASERASLRPGACPSAPAIDLLLESVELDHLKGHAAVRLSHGQRKLLEVLCALSSSPLVALLDEPFAGLGERPGQLLSHLLLAHSRKIAIVLIEHRLGLLEALNPVVNVLNGGKIQIVSSLHDCERNPEFQSIYLGIHE